MGSCPIDFALDAKDSASNRNIVNVLLNEGSLLLLPDTIDARTELSLSNWLDDVNQRPGDHDASFLKKLKEHSKKIVMFDSDDLCYKFLVLIDSRKTRGEDISQSINPNSTISLGKARARMNFRKRCYKSLRL